MPLALALITVLLAASPAVATRSNPVRSICSSAIAEWDPAGLRRETWPERVATCARLADLADAAGPHAALTLALAFEESHWSPADREGAVRGACQVAACHCPGRTFRGCDLDAACAATVARLMSEEQGSERVTLRRWLRGYRAGRKGELDDDSEKWIDAVLYRATNMERALEAVRAREGAGLTASVEPPKE